MWYFSWILGTGLALSFAVLNAIWYEILEQQPQKADESTAVPPPDEASKDHPRTGNLDR